MMASCHLPWEETASNHQRARDIRVRIISLSYMSELTSSVSGSSILATCIIANICSGLILADACIA